VQTTDDGRCHAPAGAGAWTAGDPAELGLDGSALDRVAGVLGARGERQGIVVARRGVLAFERYWANEYHRAEPTWRNVSFSSGKSWGSTMVGRALALGLLELDDPVARYHAPAVSGLHPGATIRHLLTMTSGGTLVTKPSTRPPRRIGDPTPPGPGDEYVRHAVGEPGSPAGYGVSIEPGTTFYYDGAPADHLADVVAAASGTTSHDFMMREVVGRLGCEAFAYQPEGIDGAGNVRVGGSLLLSCRDAARLGQLYLDGGRRAGVQILTPEYVAAATSPSPLNPDYGYLWWLNTSGRIAGAPPSMFYAAGARGQFCFVLPDHDMVIATMGFGRRPLTAQDAWAVLREVLPP
jgi:CubicO group peptidase (beta-lactamase class C family)